MLRLLLLFLLASLAAHVVSSPSRAVPRADMDVSYMLLGSPAVQERYELIPIDTLFYIENRGLTRILVDLNGNKFKLVSDPDEVDRSANAFLIPKFGRITVNISQYMDVERDNYIEIEPHGPPGTDAFILIGDLLVPGENVAYAIRNLTDLPGDVALLEAFPNPFHDRVTLVFELPVSWPNGMPVFLALYDALGRRIEVLVDAHMYPGSFSVDWRPRGEAASGVYFCRMTVGGRTHTIRLVYVR